MRAAVHLDMDVDRSHRVLLNIDVATVEEVFTTVRMSGRESLRRRILLVCKTHWIGRKVHGDRALCWVKVFANNYKQKCVSSRMLFFVLAENVSPFQQREKLVNRREFSYSVRSQAYREIYDIAGEP